MASTIGLRIYQIIVHRVRDRTPLSFTCGGFRKPPHEFLIEFPQDFATANQDAERERSWYFEPKDVVRPTSSKGYVHYGMYGFESDMVDARTKKRNYRRQATDVEEIPLYYEFWHPREATYALAAFQSFHGRSCINLVLTAMQQSFSKLNPGFDLLFRKLQPAGPGSSIYQDAPVKSLRLVRKNAPSDVADRYSNGAATDVVDFELTITAKKRGILGLFRNLRSSPNFENRVVIYDGVKFEEAVAQIQVGGRLRRVEVFGPNRNAGVIDLSDSVERGPDGHPTFESIAKESNEIIKNFHEDLLGVAS